MENRDRESLVAQLQREVVSSSIPISDILRKARVLASLLQNGEFKDWVDAELRGYRTTDGRLDRPEYRQFRPINLGTFAGPFGKMVKNVQIAVALLPDDLREYAEHLEVSHAVKEIESLATQAAKDGAVRFPWLPEAVILAREHVPMNDGCVLVEASRPLVKSQLDGILDQVRNRLLEFLLELQEISPDVMTSENAIRSLPSGTVTHLYQTIIHGGQNIVAAGTNFEQKSTQNVAVRDWTSLRACLSSIGVDRGSLEELENAIRHDGDLREKRFGEHVKSWTGKMVAKAMDGTWKIALNTAPRLLQEALFRYYGWDLSGSP